MSEDIIELYAKWTRHATAETARRLLEERGFVVTPMLSGCSLLGKKSQVEQAFSVSLENNQSSKNLSVPTDLRKYVASVTIQALRSYNL